jgi:RNA-directed DNA polymerase
MYGWNAIPWGQLQRNVFKLQKRIYQASNRGDVKAVHRLQRLLMRSRSAKLLAVRRVTQDNQGKKTAGVDGVKALTPLQRLSLAEALKIGEGAKPVRRVWIPKPGTTEKRPLGIPTVHDRALQTLVKLALEPEWEAKFEPYSYGFRPGRSCHDAIEMIFTSIGHRAKYALDADIAKCFDRINHQALLDKIRTTPELRRQIKAWLKSGVIDDGTLFPTEQGTMQGGTISPLLANIALHGMETVIAKRFPTRNHKRFYTPQVIKYADDLVVLHEDVAVIKECREVLAEWLKDMGLEFKPSKTRITHTFIGVDGKPGFDFLGFNVRQYPVSKKKSGKDNKGERLGFKTFIKPSQTSIQRHIQQLREIVKTHQNSEQRLLIQKLNPVIIGWSRYYSTVVSQATLDKMQYVLFSMLMAWANHRHPNKSKWWVADKYWEIVRGHGWKFQTPDGRVHLYQHNTTPIRRHTKVQGKRSPYDGDWLYWGTRLGKHPEISLRVSTLLKRQRGRCSECGLFFREADILEIDHIIPKQWGGSDARANLQLLHRHCHDTKTVRETNSKTVEGTS